ncbi:hypothetical protein ACP70R_025922 [Stipagrostis hirtigluma subsp. patula]
MFWPTLVLALAASAARLAGARLRVKTSRQYQGQLYIPEVNFFLAAAAKTTCVVLVMLITTLMAVMVHVKRYKRELVSHEHDSCWRRASRRCSRTSSTRSPPSTPSSSSSPSSTSRCRTSTPPRAFSSGRSSPAPTIEPSASSRVDFAASLVERLQHLRRRRPAGRRQHGHGAGEVRRSMGVGSMRAHSACSECFKELSMCGGW